MLIYSTSVASDLRAHAVDLLEVDFADCYEIRFWGAHVRQERLHEERFFLLK